MKTYNQTDKKPKLLLATFNPGKIREYRSLFRGYYELVTPAEIGLNITLPELAVSYEENARSKAVTGARASQLVTLADDSGLEVEALGGKPGSFSARFAGENATDKDRVSYLLSQLKDVPREKRRARFVCVIAIATPEDKIELCHGECSGFITTEPRGTNGFGYDPVFYLPELGKTMAELPLDVKNRVSHRGKAAKEALKILADILHIGVSR